MRNIFSLTTTATLVSVFTLFTLGVTGGSRAAEMDKGMDTMSSGSSLTSKEQRVFSKLDTNKDGKISPDEAKKDRNLAVKFNSADRNGDRAVDEGEFARFEADIGQNK